jgi:hypothetical protein
VTLGVVMAVVIIVRPSGLTGGREVTLDGLRRAARLWRPERSAG